MLKLMQSKFLRFYTLLSCMIAAVCGCGPAKPDVSKTSAPVTVQTVLPKHGEIARNITLPGGMLDVQGKNLSIDPSGEFKSEKEIGDVAITSSSSGTPVYLRDLVDVVRGYQSPARFLNYYEWRDPQGNWPMRWNPAAIAK